MLSLNRAQQRLPIGGHQFPESGITLRGDTFDEVVKELTDFRLNNGKPLGNPKMEVLLYYAKNWPYMVKDDLRPNEEEKTNENYQRWMSWIHTMWKTPPVKLLTPKEASYRWDKCKECPMNKKKDWPSSPESGEVDRRAYLLRQGIEVPKDIGFCSCHAADVAILSFLEAPEKSSNKKKDETQPEQCWVPK